MNYFEDSLIRRLYAQDASMYEEMPLGVALPRSTEEIVNLVKQAQLDSFTITARSAGTSLAGQTTGNGVIMDVSKHLTSILELNEEERWIEVEPGVIRDTINRKVAEHNLLFGPDTATTSRCMIGGMIGNNSAGAFSIKYKTTREHVMEMETVLSDGSVVNFKPLTVEELEDKLLYQTLEGDIYRGMLELLTTHKETIEKCYPHPEIIRRNTGYALDKLLEMEPFTEGGRPFNLCELLCGSEGTLAITTKAKLNLDRLNSHKMLLIPHFKNLDYAMKATVEAVKLKPAAVELVDHIILDATKTNRAQKENRFFLSGEPSYILIVQFEGDNPGILEMKIERLKKALRESKLCYSYPIVKEEEKIQQVWELRKAGLGLLMGLGKESRTPAFCEDTSVRVIDLPNYIKDFQEILSEHELDCVFYAHASVGELHLRPMIDTTSEDGVEKMKVIAEEIAELVSSYRGSLSGEHGDGRARSPYIEKVLGEEMIPILEEVKEIWDKHGIFNPGKIVDPKPIDENLRFSPVYKEPEIDTVFAWRNEEGIVNQIESCNGAGVCRKIAESGGTMCPSYMATNDEKDSTRGRANVFRQVFEGKSPEGFDSKDLKDALDLCLSCKACKSECPANVDMAKMKAEFDNGWNERNGASLQTQFFSSTENVYKMGARFRPMVNALIRSAFGRYLFKKFLKIHPERSIPEFVENPIKPGFYKTNKQPIGTVALFVDLFTRHHQPEIARDALKVFHFLGYNVVIPELSEIGRVQISKGMLYQAKLKAREVLEALHPLVKDNIPIIGLEPSEILTLRDEFSDLVEEDELDDAKEIAKASFLFEEFMFSQKIDSTFKSEKTIYIHNHCHSKVLSSQIYLPGLFKNWGFKVDTIDAGCCGMAGSFGYDENKYDLSMKIGSQRLFPTLRSLDKKSNICAPGFSCRHQIFDGTGLQALHPATIIAQQIPKNN